MNVSCLPICQACLPDLDGTGAIDNNGCRISLVPVNAAYIGDDDGDDDQGLHTDPTLDIALLATIPATPWRPTAATQSEWRHRHRRAGLLKR
eukprot:862432-Pleurochrysis_carterae.AAC.1